jgi:hypothetical protein
MLGTRTTCSQETKHEDDFHDGGSRCHRIFRGFFHRDPRSGKDGTDHTSGTLLPVIRSRNGLRLYKLRAMRGDGFRHRRQLHTSRGGTPSRRSSSARVTNLHPGFISAVFLRHRDQGFRRPARAAQPDRTHRARRKAPYRRHRAAARQIPQDRGCVLDEHSGAIRSRNGRRRARAADQEDRVLRGGVRSVGRIGTLQS